ncbi:hypothetical protein MSAN_01994000 [Mycena sanguinolenta]|uniref:Uncharacterized protein n=1 Tax=Mycena sanguinolenta TaxID=230812 RepID=A0A8H6XM34_9AGAR|nr:hypothetical protein MSAN_01994000 [Mycena sanguinolenta]
MPRYHPGRPPRPLPLPLASESKRLTFLHVVASCECGDSELHVAAFVTIVDCWTAPSSSTMPSSNPQTRYIYIHARLLRSPDARGLFGRLLKSGECAPIGVSGVQQAPSHLSSGGTPRPDSRRSRPSLSFRLTAFCWGGGRRILLLSLGEAGTALRPFWLLAVRRDRSLVSAFDREHVYPRPRASLVCLRPLPHLQLSILDLLGLNETSSSSSLVGR